MKRRMETWKAPDILDKVRAGSVRHKYARLVSSARYGVCPVAGALRPRRGCRRGRSRGVVLGSFVPTRSRHSHARWRTPGCQTRAGARVDSFSPARNSARIGSGAFAEGGNRTVPSSLQDQLKKVGLTDDKQIKKVESEKRRKRKARPIQWRRARRGSASARASVERARAERDRQRNLQCKAQAERKATAAQIRQLIETNRQSREDGDVAYHFTVGTAIKQLYVPKRMHEQITRGALAIVSLDEGYEVVPIAVAEKDRGARPGTGGRAQTPLVCPTRVPSTRTTRCPDDLMW